MGSALKWILVGALVGLPIAGVLVSIKMGQFQAMADAAAQVKPQPTPVNAWTVAVQEWEQRRDSVDTVSALRGITVRTEAEGTVREIGFTAGATVAAGEVLVRLDTDAEQAQLREAEAAADLARLTRERAENLARSRNISQRELDAARSDLERAQAQVAYIRALIDRKTLRAPFAGRLGIRQVSIGQYLTKGAPVVSLQSPDPVLVGFSMPQRILGELADGQAVEVTADAWPGEVFRGVITAIEPAVDEMTRNVRLQATLANPTFRLRPGMFVEVSVRLGHKSQVLAVPSTALVYGPHGATVFLLREPEQPAADGQQVLEERTVRPGAQRGDFIAIAEGLAAGERIVSTGPFKLRSGMAVVIDNTLAPDFRLDPQPDNT